MATPLKIDFVSDVVCPWCAIGLSALEQAIARVGADVQVEMHFQPFELNPQMPPEGQDIGEHLAQKYGSTPEQQARNYEAIRQRGEALGFEFRLGGRGRTWNTFDAHRLLYWAGEVDAGKQRALKKALLRAYFTEAQNPGARDVLLQAAEAAGLDTARAAEVIDSGEYAEATRAQEQFYQRAGIHSVPAIIFNDKHLISGGQPVEVFEQALRQLAAQPA